MHERPEISETQRLQNALKDPDSGEAKGFNLALELLSIDIAELRKKWGFAGVIDGFEHPGFLGPTPRQTQITGRLFALDSIVDAMLELRATYCGKEASK